MSDNNQPKKRIMKIIGICMIVLGVVFIIVGITGFTDWDSPRYIFMPIGILVSGIGSMVLVFAFRQQIIAHQAKVYAPILKELKQEIMPDKNVVNCPDCGTANDVDSKYCKECGKPLRKVCPYCNADVNNDSKFCPKCGRSL